MRQASMRARLHGVSGSQSFVGILHMHKVINRLSAMIALEEGFATAEQKTKLQGIKDTSTSVVATLHGVANSLAEVYQKGFHPYVNSLRQSLGSPEAIRAISS